MAGTFPLTSPYSEQKNVAAGVKTAVEKSKEGAVTQQHAQRWGEGDSDCAQCHCYSAATILYHTFKGTGSRDRIKKYGKK
jgi:hypothetical protein